MLNFSALMVGANDAAKLVNFYKQVFGKDPDWEEKKIQFAGWQVGNGHFMIGAHSKVKGSSPNPERVIVNFETEDVEGEFNRIKNLDGAAVVAEPYHPGDEKDMSMATLADPEGNYFQLATPYKMK